MTQIVLYIAVSLDGYIATPDGGVDWLSAVETEGEDYGYAAFYDSVDALLLGSRTYEQVLGFGAWPYPGKPSWIFTRRRLDAVRPEVTLTARSPVEIISELQARNLCRVWLVGGAELAASFRAQGLIDEYILSFIPVLLGAGIPLFKPPGPGEHLTLTESKSYPSGLVQLCYRRDR